MPCICHAKGKNQKTGRPASRKPKSLAEWQVVTAKIYPDKEDLDFDLLLKQDQLHQLFRHFRKSMGKTLMKDIEASCADYFISLLRIFNSLDLDAGEVFTNFYTDGCYVCHQTPCQCFYNE